MRADRFDLNLIVGCALLAAVAAFVPALDGPPRIVFGLLLVLVAPGYALQAAFDRVRRMRWTERLVIAVGVSLALTALTGLLLNLLPMGLQRESWTVALGGTTLLTCLIAGWRRRRAPEVFALPATRPRARELVAVLGALVLGGVGFAVATEGAQQPRTSFTELWLVPPDTGEPTSVGVRSMELSPATFHVQVVSGAQTLVDSEVQLAPGQTWQTNLDVRDAAIPVDAVVYRDGTDVPYRRAHLAPQAPAVVAAQP